MRGEVVGVNSQIFTTSGAYAGISFAIPIDEAMRIGDQLRTSGKVVRGRIGVLIGEVSREVAEAIGLQKAAGALVSSVEGDGPADKAGVKPGDVIIKYEGKPVESSSDLRRMVASTKPGAKVTATVWRNGAPRDLQITVSEMQADQPRQARADQGHGAAPAVDALGLAVSDIPADQQKELKIKGGVQVDNVDGAAALAGIRSGDYILSINNAEVTNAKQYAELVAKLDLNKPAALLVRSGEQSRYVIVHPSEH
jgi:serine protease Do